MRAYGIRTTARRTRSGRLVRFILTLMFVVSLAMAGGAHAANKYAGEFLTHGVGARALGMGSAFVAVADDVTSGYWNPAGIADADARSVHLMHSETFGDVVNYDTGAYVHPLSADAALAVTFIRLAVDDIPFTDGFSVTDDGTVEYNEDDIVWESDSEMAALISYARGSSERLRLGGNLKLIRKSIGNYSCYGLGFDLGAKYDVTRRTTLGINVHDVTTTFLVWDTKQRERIMPTVKVGVAYTTPVSSMDGVVTAAVDADVRFENRLLADEYHIGSISADTHYGLEFVYRDMVGVRTGLAMGQLTAGAGLNLAGFTVDYAFGKHEYLDSSHRVSASYGF